MTEVEEGTTYKLGEILVKEGWIPIDAVQRVLDIQRESNYISSSARKYQPFGQICVDLKLITREELRTILRKHQKSIRLGDLLIKMRLITAKDLEKALKRQESKPDMRLGEILLEHEALSEVELVEALSMQWDIPIILPALELIDVSLLDGMDLKYMVESGFLPVSASEDEVMVIMADPNDFNLINYLEMHYGKKISRAIGPASAMRQALKSYYLDRKARLEKARQQSQQASKKASEDAPDFSGSSFSGVSLYGGEEEEEAPKEEAPKGPEVLEDTLIVGGVSLASKDAEPAHKQQQGMLNYLIKNALLDQATAIHIEPQGAFLRVRYRIDGVLTQKTSLPANLGNPMVARLKQITALNPDAQDLPQRNRVQASFNDQAMELSIATYPGVHGETMVLTLRQKQSNSRAVPMNLEQTGCSPLSLWRLKKALSKPGGLVFFSGPARSGKTTTAYAALNALNLLTCSIATAESPIEQTLTGITQGNWTPESGVTYPEMIRSMSFLDPDILMVSEVDTPETLEAVVELALGGAKVITSFSSFDTMGTLLRLSALGLNNFLIASSNVTLVSQRLVRKLCPQCKQEDHPHEDYLKFLGLSQVDPEAAKVGHPRGCQACNQLGYVGQTAIHEILVINDAIREAILENAPAAHIRNLARTDGRLISMAEDGYAKAVAGITTLAEVQRVAFINEYDSQQGRSAEEILAACSAQNQEFL